MKWEGFIRRRYCEGDKVLEGDELVGDRQGKRSEVGRFEEEDLLWW